MSSTPQPSRLDRNPDPFAFDAVPSPGELFRSEPLTTRIPHLGHALLFLLLTAISIALAGVAVVAFAHGSASAAAANQKLQLVANMLGYAVALAAALLVFPALWHRPFALGVHWNARAVRLRLLGLGLGIGVVSLAVSSLLPQKPDMPIEQLFHNRALLTILPLFGIVVAPLFEELFFRGFLLPALCIGIDYMRLPRVPDAVAAWRTREEFSPLAMIVASLITSLLFGLVHGFQLSFDWSAVALLCVVSLVLCAVRLRLRSLAASTLVHACYNLAIFLALAIASHGFRDLSKV